MECNSISLLTISPDASFSARLFRKFKNFIRNKFFFYGGPQSVLDSLLDGFNALDVAYQLNPKSDKVFGVVGVLSDVGALRWAIEAKKQGKIKCIIAGPNLVITPLDENKVLLDKTIDIVLVPSLWVKDFCLSLAPELANKIHVWAAGVKDVYAPSAKNRHGCLLYRKKADDALFEGICKMLEAHRITYRSVPYGHYSKRDYFAWLNEAECMIYMSESESQGLALTEAWMQNTPTLVWNRGYWKHKNYEWHDNTISAPYLTEESGMFFQNVDDFNKKLPKFLSRLSQFQARTYALNNFSNEVTSKKYLKIIQTFCKR